MSYRRVNIADMPNMGETVRIKSLAQEDARKLIDMGGTPGTIERVSGLRDVSFPLERVIGNVQVGFDAPANGYNEYVIDGCVYAKVYSGKYASVIEELR